MSDEWWVMKIEWPKKWIQTAPKLLTEAFNLVFFFFFPYILRLCNSVVHNIIKHARHVSGLSVWMKNILSHFSNVIATDVIGVS